MGYPDQQCPQPTSSHLHPGTRLTYAAVLSAPSASSPLPWPHDIQLDITLTQWSRDEPALTDLTNEEIIESLYEAWKMVVHNLDWLYRGFAKLK